jgi:hypothetical protein
MDMQDLTFNDVGQPGIRDLHEEWGQARRPLDRTIVATQVPFSGSTSRAKAAIPLPKQPSQWVERPVATGKFALKHMGGKRYVFNKEPRYLEWEEYLATINPIRD